MRRASVSALPQALAFSGIDQLLSRPLPRLRNAETSPATNCFRRILRMSSKPSAITDPMVAAAMVLTFMTALYV
jgi:hypothetical protein